MASNYVVKSKIKMVFMVKLLIEIMTKNFKLRKPEKSGFRPGHETANLRNE